MAVKRDENCSCSTYLSRTPLAEGVTVCGCDWDHRLVPYIQNLFVHMSSLVTALLPDNND
jgi:hypothetical protein